MLLASCLAAGKRRCLIFNIIVNNPKVLLLDDGSGNGYALLLAAAHLLRFAVAEVFQLREVEHLIDALIWSKNVQTNYHH